MFVFEMSICIYERLYSKCQRYPCDTSLRFLHAQRFAPDADGLFARHLRGVTRPAMGTGTNVFLLQTNTLYLCDLLYI